MGAKRTAQKSLCQGEAVPTVNRFLRVSVFFQRDETWLPEWSGKLGGVQRWRSSVARVSWGKPVFRLTASSQLAESLARGPGGF